MRGATLLFAAALCLAPGTVAAQITERLYQQACDDGDLTACNIFGLMYEYGEAVPQNLERAASLYQRACEGGDMVGCTNLGLLYETGAGVTEDVDRASGLYQVACEGGELLGCDLVAGAGQARASDTSARFFKSGRIADTETGAALSQAVIEVPALGVRVVSDMEGRFELGRLPAGQHLLRAERFGYELVQGRLEVPGNAEFLVLLSQANVVDPREPGRIEGQVTGGGSQGLADVQITVLGQPRGGTLSNQQGRFALRDVQPGFVEVRFVRLGYAPRTATLIVQPGRTSEIATTMSTEPIELEAIQVTVRSSMLELNGFYRRAQRGFGAQLSRTDLDKINPIYVSDAVRRIPGVRLASSNPLNPDEVTAVSRRASSFSLGPCTLSVYIDGVRMSDPDLNQLSPDWLEAMEVYSGVGTPVEYGGPRNPCGVVLLWTQR